MKILLVEPLKFPCLKEIDGSLESMQSLVDGYIQAIFPYDDPVALVCNEEGKLLSLSLNRSLEDYDIIAGTFFICGLGEDDFEDLPLNLLQKYEAKFHTPQVFYRTDSGIIGLLLNPDREEPQ